MRNIKITGCGAALPENTVYFGGQTRYRLKDGQTILDLAEKAVKEALEKSGLAIKDIDLIIGGTATPLQAIPCNAALLHERIAKGTNLIDSGNYKNILIFSGGTASGALNPNQKESYELFSDAATAFVVSACNGESGVIHSKQHTYSEGVHDTEIRGGCGLLTAFKMTAENKEDYYFDMKGKRVLKLTATKMPEFFNNFLKDMGMTVNDIDFLIPHQASKALKLIMERLNVPKEKYIDRVSEWGNMISAAVPMALYTAINEGKIKRGNKIVLCGTAAGLTFNALCMVY